MKPIKFDISPLAFFTPTRRESFYNDPIPGEACEIAGFYQPPVYEEQPDDFNPGDYELV